MHVPLQAMSDELRERIERNKRLAMERRMKRLGTTPNSRFFTVGKVTVILWTSFSNVNFDW